MKRLSILFSQSRYILACIILVVFVGQKAGFAWDKNLISVEKTRATSAVNCIMQVHSGLWKKPCPQMEAPKGSSTDYFRYLDGWRMLSRGQEKEALSLWRAINDSDLFTMSFGISAYHAGDVELALAYFELTQQINPQIDDRKWPMYYTNCEIYLHKSQFADAIPACEFAAQFSDEDLPMILLVRAYLGDGRYEKGIEVLNKFLLGHPKHSTVLSLRATAYRSLGHLEAAEQDYQAAIAGDQLVPAAFIGLGRVYIESDRPEKAVEVLNKLLLIQPRRSDALYWRATAFRNLGNLEAAEQDYQAAIAGDQLVPAAYIDLADLFVSRNEICKGRDLLLEAEQNSSEELRRRAQKKLDELEKLVCD